MSTTLITYANARFRYIQRLNRQSAEKWQYFDRIDCLGSGNIDREFWWAHRHILRKTRGAGYWLWKPYFVSAYLADSSDGDVIFYCDSGCLFRSSPAPLCELAKEGGQDIIPFEGPHLERAYTKRDAFVLLEAERSEYVESRQRSASYILFRASARSRRFAADWLRFATDERILTDMPNTLGRDNYRGFVEHRHDQSIFSILSKKYGLAAFRSPSQFGEAARERFPECKYGQIIDHTRYVRDPWYFLRPSCWPDVCARIADRVIRRARQG